MTRFHGAVVLALVLLVCAPPLGVTLGTPPCRRTPWGNASDLYVAEHVYPSPVDEHVDACLTQGDHRGVPSPRGERLIILKRSQVPSTVRILHEYPDNTAFLASDLCVMGHTPKDAAHLLTWLMQNPDRILHRVVYGNNCMTRIRTPGSSKRTLIWHNVLLGWFRAVLAPLPKAPEVLYYEDIIGGAAVCFGSVLKRAEHYRWFALPSHASEFRSRLWAHYNITPQPRTPKARVTILRRDEDRHFNESYVASYLSSTFSNFIDLSLVTFDRVRSGASFRPPTHSEQLTTLSNTDVLIAAHGAGLSAVIAMPGDSVVIELFPNGLRYAMYEELARLAGLHYLAVESDIPWPRGCCSSRPVPLTRPSDVHGVGTRVCKKCDVHVSHLEWVFLMTESLRYLGYI